MLEILMAKDLVYAAAGNMYANPMNLPKYFEKSAKVLGRIASVLSVLSIYIINIYRGDAGVRMISEHRAQFCMIILDKLQDRLPVVAAFYPIYESLLKRKSAGLQSTPERPATGPSIQVGTRQLDNDTHLESINTTGGLFDQVLQDSMGAMFPFSFPLGNLFEDVFLGAPSETSLS